MRQCIVVAIWVQKAAGGLLRIVLALAFAALLGVLSRRGSDWSQCTIPIGYAAFVVDLNCP
jgi:hypothetical protein